MMEMRKATGRFQRRRTLRLTAEEAARLNRQVATAGISISEYMRRFFFGGRPIIAKTDDQTIRELRRLGGLLKHHFDVVKRTRSVGYTQGDAANEIFRHTPARPHGQDRAERIDYCRRLTGYTFGAVGDIDLAAVRPIPEQIQKFNRESDSIAQEQIEHNRSIIRL